jgi:hypothetical protein
MSIPVMLWLNWVTSGPPISERSSRDSGAGRTGRVTSTLEMFNCPVAAPPCGEPMAESRSCSERSRLAAFVLVAGMRKDGGVRPVEATAGGCAGGPKDWRLNTRLVGPVLIENME